MDYHKVNCGKTNCYLLKTAYGWMLVDCGWDYDRPDLDDGLRRIGIAYSEISWLFITHHHGGHAGLANYLLSRNPDIIFIMHPKCGEFMAAGRNNRPVSAAPSKRRRGLFSRRHDERGRQESSSYPPYGGRESDYYVCDEGDDILQSLGLNARVLFTPGHSDDSISILFGDGTLFCGDAAGDAFGRADNANALSEISNEAAYWGSREKMIRGGAHTVFPSHGNPFSAGRLAASAKGIPRAV